MMSSDAALALLAMKLNLWKTDASTPLFKSSSRIAILEVTPFTCDPSKAMLSFRLKCGGIFLTKPITPVHALVLGKTKLQAHPFPSCRTCPSRHLSLTLPSLRLRHSWSFGALRRLTILPRRRYICLQSRRGGRFGWGLKWTLALRRHHKFVLLPPPCRREVDTTRLASNWKIIHVFITILH